MVDCMCVAHCKIYIRKCRTKALAVLKWLECNATSMKMHVQRHPKDAISREDTMGVKGEDTMFKEEALELFCVHFLLALLFSVVED